MNRIGLLVVGLLCLALLACSGDDEAVASTQSTDELRDAVQAYSDAYLTGDMAAYEMLTERCRDRLSQEQFRTLVAMAKSMYGSALPVRSFDAEVSGDLARVTYTYDVSAINQNAEPWTREGGVWKEDDC